MPLSDHGTRLLGLLGVDLCADIESDPVADWAASGAMALTGRSNGPPLPVAGPATALRGALAALHVLAPKAELPGVELLGERAAIAGLTRQSPVSPGGGTRLLTANDGPVAVTLARNDDFESVPAVLGDNHVDRPWDALEAWAARTSAQGVEERCRLLGLAVAVPHYTRPRTPYSLTEIEGREPSSRAPLVVDLSSLWAGPLCSQLLRLCGARVVTVESTRRPDGSRRGPKAFHDLMRSETESVALDLTQPGEVDRLRELLKRADIVVEASRPRALEQMGIDARAVLAAPGARTWVRISAYGDGPRANDIGYGDDAAVAAGVLAPGLALAGDALGDPLAGAHAAVAALAGHRLGASRMVGVALREVLAFSRQPLPTATAELRNGRWHVGDTEVADPRARVATHSAPDLGEHTDAVLAELC